MNDNAQHTNDAKNSRDQMSDSLKRLTSILEVLDRASKHPEGLDGVDTLGAIKSAKEAAHDCWLLWDQNISADLLRHAARDGETPILVQDAIEDVERGLQILGALEKLWPNPCVEPTPIRGEVSNHRVEAG